MPHPATGAALSSYKRSWRPIFCCNFVAALVLARFLDAVVNLGIFGNAEFDLRFDLGVVADVVVDDFPLVALDVTVQLRGADAYLCRPGNRAAKVRSEEHTSELQSRS